MREVAGVVFLIGLIVYVASFFVGSRDPEPIAGAVEPAAA